MGLEKGQRCIERQMARRQKMVEILSDDAFDRLMVKEKAAMVGVSEVTWRKYLRDDPDIYNEALAIRRKAYAKYSPDIDEALMRACKNGNPAALKLWYERHEQWVARQHVEQSGELTIKQVTDVPPRPANYKEWVKSRLEEVL